MIGHPGAFVDWPTLRDWCTAHGAKNDLITSICIDGAGDQFSVILEGNELNEAGKPFLAGRNEVAKWRSTQPLRFLP